MEDTTNNKRSVVLPIVRFLLLSLLSYFVIQADQRVVLYRVHALTLVYAAMEDLLVFGGVLLLLGMIKLALTHYGKTFTFYYGRYLDIVAIVMITHALMLAFILMTGGAW